MTNLTNLTYFPDFGKLERKTATHTEGASPFSRPAEKKQEYRTFTKVRSFFEIWT
jgi:hypothetical protein